MIYKNNNKNDSFLSTENKSFSIEFKTVSFLRQKQGTKRLMKDGNYNFKNV